jgi:hypothetical protein
MPTDGGGQTLEDVAAELYGLPLAEFTAARNSRAKQVREAGDRELAEAIRGLGKPTMVAWLVNQMAREHPEEIRSLVELGGALRDATATLDGDQLRQLSRQQQQVVYALVQQVRSLGRAAGHPVSQDTARGVEETLHAALADPDAAAQVGSGRLTGELSRSGFPATATTAPASPPRTDDRAPAAGKADTGARLAAAERDVAAAQAALRESAALRDRAQEVLERTRAEAEAVAGRIEQLQRRLEQAMAEQAEAQRRLRAAQGEAGRAERRVRQDEQRLTDSTARQQRLRG